MSEPLQLSPEESSYLVGLLEKSLKDARVEEHRTRAPRYREQILQEEDVIKSLLLKLGKAED